MSFNMWQKLMAASTENAVVACCEAAAVGEALTSNPRTRSSRSLAERRLSRRPRAAASGIYNRRMAHVIEHASSGRAKCRSCDQPIAKGELRFGERQPNAFGDGEMTLWFHLPCGAYSRPEPFLEAQSASPAGGELDALKAAARFGIEHRRVPRLHGAERAASGRASCRSCLELIGKGCWGASRAGVWSSPSACPVPWRRTSARDCSRHSGRFPR
jgi:hypothetical protein